MVAGGTSVSGFCRSSVTLCGPGIRAATIGTLGLRHIAVLRVRRSCSCEHPTGGRRHHGLGETLALTSHPRRYTQSNLSADEN
jgi:hypothetical protein